MSAEHPVLGRLEALLDRYRDQIARLGPEVAHLRAERETVMQYLSSLSTSVAKLISDRQASDARADAALAENAALKAQITADEATLKGMLDKVDAEVTTETGPAAGTASAATVTTSPSGAVVTTVPADAAPATSATTGAVTQPGTTTHVDLAGTTITFDHATGTATAVDATATTVEPAPAAVVEAQAATVAAGVTVPSAS